jgi:Rps23 Pro-64 3,4-dihydroxylase Tpa1-like proline 4-hydroxylase
MFHAVDFIGDDNTKKYRTIETSVESMVSMCEKLQNVMAILEKELLCASDSAWNHDITREILESKEKEYVHAKTEYLRVLSEYNNSKAKLKELEDDLRSRGYTLNTFNGIPGVFMVPPMNVYGGLDCKKWWEFWK